MKARRRWPIATKSAIRLSGLTVGAALLWLLQPALPWCGTDAQTLRVKATFRQLELALTLYAESADGHLPVTLNALVESELFQPESLRDESLDVIHYFRLADRRDQAPDAAILLLYAHPSATYTLDYQGIFHRMPTDSGGTLLR